MRTRFQGLEVGSASSKVELVDLTTPEPTHDDGSSNVSTPPIIDLVTPEPVLVVDLSTPKPDQLVALVVDLSTLNQSSSCQLFLYQHRHCQCPNVVPQASSY
jgi:hypothetical protein